MPSQRALRRAARRAKAAKLEDDAVAEDEAAASAAAVAAKVAAAGDPVSEAAGEDASVVEGGGAEGESDGVDEDAMDEDSVKENNKEGAEKKEETKKEAKETAKAKAKEGAKAKPSSKISRAQSAFLQNYVAEVTLEVDSRCSRIMATADQLSDSIRRELKVELLKLPRKLCVCCYCCSSCRCGASLGLFADSRFPHLPLASSPHSREMPLKTFLEQFGGNRDKAADAVAVAGLRSKTGTVRQSRKGKRGRGTARKGKRGRGDGKGPGTSSKRRRGNKAAAVGVGEERGRMILTFSLSHSVPPPLSPSLHPPPHRRATRTLSPAQALPTG